MGSRACLVVLLGCCASSFSIAKKELSAGLGSRAQPRCAATSLDAAEAPASLDAVVGAANAGLLSEAEKALAGELLALGQTHLFEAWPSAGTEDEGKVRLVQALAKCDASYVGGLSTYILKSRVLLAEAARGENPFAGFSPEVPDGETLTWNTPHFEELEAAGLVAARRTGFVLVAGGLGERLGYEGIKLELPVEGATSKSFVQLYVEFVLALERRARSDSNDQSLVLPLVIMTSDDTDAPTRALLAANDNFGMSAAALTVLKQDKVAALSDANAALALDDDDRWELLTKPHGHGDVHSLMRSSGVARTWRDELGLKHVFFFQDTNPLVLLTVLAALGVSETRGFSMNSVCVPRRAGEAAGAVTRLVSTDGDSAKDLVINVEYNQLDPLLRAASADGQTGDVNDAATGMSPFPGNANVLVLALDDYVTTLEGAAQGVVDEFVNPKYKDATKCAFKKPTRLECMMQDYPKLLQRELPDANVGFTTFERWLAFSPAKNALDAARGASTAGEPAGCAASAEFDVFAAHHARLFGDGVPSDFSLTLSEVSRLYGGPRVVLAPSFALTQADVRAKVVGAVTLAPGAALVLEGENVRVEGPLTLNGFLSVVNTRADATLVIKDLTVTNAGLAFADIPDAQLAQASPTERIRGYRTTVQEHLRVVIDEPGHFLLSGQGKLTKLNDAPDL